jgi:hypothetical protein
MGSTATDIAAVATAASTAAAQIIAAATGGTAPTSGSMIDPTTGLPYGSVNPATGMPYGAINPATGRPYGEIEETSYVPFVIGALAIVGVGGYLLTRRRPTPNRRRRMRTNGKRKTKDVYEVQGDYGYGHGFEMVTSEDTRPGARDRLREYRANEPGIPFKIKKVRERI